MKWKTREGDLIDIVDLTNSHLTNIILFLRRNCDRYRMQLVEIGDLNHYQVDDESFLSEHIPQYDSLIEEVNKRNLSGVIS